MARSGASALKTNSSVHGLQTLATHIAGDPQKWLAAAACAAFAIATAYLLPQVTAPAIAGAGFLAVNQSMLIVVYGLTTFLLFAQYGRARSPGLLALAAGNLFTTIIVVAQLLTFPNLLAQGRILGDSAATTTWLWTFWHLGPPAYALAFAWLAVSDDQISPRQPSRRLAWLAAAVATLAAIAAVVVSLKMLDLLPKQVESDGSYWPVTTSGVGPVVVGFNLLALVVLCWRTRLRTVLQLWIAVGLFLLLLDNLLTLPAAARDTVGWAAGRVEALLAGLAVLGVLLRQVEGLYARAEATVVERAREGAELKLARDNLAMALEAAEMGDWELDLATGESRRTLNHDRIFGYNHLLPHWGLENLYEHVIPEDRPIARAAIEGAWLTGSFDLVCRINPANGGPPRWIAKRGKAYFDAAGEPAVMAGVVMDVTARHEMDERLAQAQRMESIGQLTGGVAHDFNNLLTVIVGNFDMIERKPDDPVRVARLASTGLQAARRGAEMTEKLLAFSRRQALRPEVLHTDRVARTFTPLLARALGESIAIDLDLVARRAIRVDCQQFESALLNLAVNAKDAGATLLRIETRDISLARGDDALRSDMPPGDYVRVSVIDNGEGMDQATAGRAVEPFFTTKDVGKGTGLGLSQVYGFARQAGGHVTIDSTPGRGTSIALYLPQSLENADQAQGAAKTVALLRRATEGEVVLVVEDEPTVREMAIESLQEMGYQTLSANHAQAALELLRQDQRIDILFSDVIMPGGMNGVQLTVEARRIRPDLKVVLASGYATTALDGASVPDDVPLIRKPYEREVLASTLRTVLRR
jgi:signal transduction histidine kinase/CheY-like chemotaxis protein